MDDYLVRGWSVVVSKLSLFLHTQNCLHIGVAFVQHVRQLCQ